MRRLPSGCCALAASGHAAAAPPSSEMNARRLMEAFPRASRPDVTTPLHPNAAVHHSKNCALMSQMGRVSRVSPVHTAVRNCTRDEGGPFGIGYQGLISSHRKLLLSKAIVVSVAETLGHDPGRQRPNIGSRVNREVHARFWERAEVRFLRATRQQRRLSVRSHKVGFTSVTRHWW